MSSLLWLCVLVGAAVAVGGFYFLGRRSLIQGRAPIELRDIHAAIDAKVRYETFEKLFVAIAQAYSVDPRYLRPNDSLNRLSTGDTWVLGVGTDKLNAFLANTGISKIDPDVKTILDLLLLLDRPGDFGMPTESTKSETPKPLDQDHSRQLPHH